MGQVGGNQHNPERNPYDDYPTDPFWTASLLNLVHFRGQIWEPAAGEGAMVQVLRDWGHVVRATDLQRDGVDFLEQSDPWVGSIITNPPYRHADLFLEKALELATEQVAMLLNINGLGGKKRTAWLWGPRPPGRIIIVPRYMNVRDRTSQFYHVWCVWDHQHDRGHSQFQWAQVPANYTRLRHPTELAALR